jgi:negative regulator of flagellin synthesis FlgM
MRYRRNASRNQGRSAWPGSSKPQSHRSQRMQINGPTHLHGAHPVSAPHDSRLAQPTGQTQSSQITDELQISEAARLAEQSQSSQEVRAERVETIRAQIAQGTYETPEKLDVAVARLLNEIG